MDKTNEMSDKRILWYSIGEHFSMFCPGKSVTLEHFIVVTVVSQSRFTKTVTYELNIDRFFKIIYTVVYRATGAVAASCTCNPL